MMGRRLFVLGAGLGALLAVSVALRAAAKSPEEAVRLFVRACERGDWRAAKALLTERSRPELVPVERFWVDLKEGLVRGKPLWYPLGEAVKAEFQVGTGQAGAEGREKVPVLANLTFNFVAAREGEGWKVDLPATFGMEPEDYAHFVERWHERALTDKCQFNLKQIALAVWMYVSDWERFPPADRWCDAIRPYVREEGIFTCPAVAEKGNRWGYAMNWKLSKRLLSEVDDHAHTVVIYETENLRKNACGDGRDLPRKGRHAGGNNFAFVDGHIRWLRADIEEPIRLFRLKKGPGFKFPPRPKGVPRGTCPVCW